METGAVLVSLGFGFLVGFGLAGFLPDDRRPTLVSLLVALAAGVLVLSASLGDEPALVGGSLVIGAGAGLAGTLLHSRMTDSGAGPIP